MRLVDIVGVEDEGACGADVDSDGHPERVIDGSHPPRVTARKVVVDRDEVDALARERVEIEREAGDQSLAFASLHLRDLSLVEDDAAHQLLVEVAKADRAPACLAAERKRLDQQLVEVVPLARLLAEPIGAYAQGAGVELLELWLESIDRLGHRKVAFDLSLVRIEQLGKDDHDLN